MLVARSAGIILGRECSVFIHKMYGCHLGFVKWRKVERKRNFQQTLESDCELQTLTLFTSINQ